MRALVRLKNPQLFIRLNVRESVLNSLKIFALSANAERKSAPTRANILTSLSGANKPLSAPKIPLSQAQTIASNAGSELSTSVNEASVVSTAGLPAML